jgi:hypothetical protein
MDKHAKLNWLRRVLLVKVLLTFFAWGLPALFGSEQFLSLFDLSMPEDPTYLRLFGAAVTAFGAAYWFAYRDPIRNRAILSAGVVDNGLITLTVVFLAATGHVDSWFMYVSAALTASFCAAFVLLMPAREERVALSGVRDRF